METKRIELLKMKLEILKLKADDYQWACHVDKETKASLESMLVEIDNTLKAPKSSTSGSMREDLEMATRIGLTVVDSVLAPYEEEESRDRLTAIREKYKLENPNGNG